MAKKADDAFSTVATFAFAVGLVMFILAWVHNELPAPLMRLIAYLFHASPTGGR